MALADMYAAEANTLFTVRELCDRLQVSFDVMSKAMQGMAKAEILGTVQGVHGGYQTVMRLDELNLLDLIRAVHGPIRIVNCLNAEKDCSFEATCQLIDPMTELDRRLNEFYAGVQLKDLIGDSGACACDEPKLAAS